ncbi:MAG: deoxyribodipyrimidine photo-lyase [Gammaproteobacteria bacterium]|jgi:deoxyribodipyrimidine photo-lyase
MNIFWFRRDLRLEDNAALFAALQSGETLPIFIFDTNILDKLNDTNDRRVSFIYEKIQYLKNEIESTGGTLLVFHGKPVDIFRQLLKDFQIDCVYACKDYEPYAVKRDAQVQTLLRKNNVILELIKDHVIFESNEVLKKDDTPYIIYTPYMRAWKKRLGEVQYEHYASEDLSHQFKKQKPASLLNLNDIGFVQVEHGVEEPCLEPDILQRYHRTRDYPHEDASSYIGPHLRFGTISIRTVISIALDMNETWLNQLIWREFFIQILSHFPRTASKSFREKYDAIPWRNNKKEFNKWCDGKTGFPIVDAGMRQLKETGYMHNRVRMITANFLSKLLLVDWRWGEKWFAEELLDYEMANNIGGWQWSAGSGCDAAPYFRIFNPDTQIKKFDPEYKYIKKWVPEFDTADYPLPMIDYRDARQRALAVYKTALSQ